MEPCSPYGLFMFTQAGDSLYLKSFSAIILTLWVFSIVPLLHTVTMDLRLGLVPRRQLLTYTANCLLLALFIILFGFIRNRALTASGIWPVTATERLWLFIAFLSPLLKAFLFVWPLKLLHYLKADHCGCADITLLAAAAFVLAPQQLCLCLALSTLLALLTHCAQHITEKQPRYFLHRTPPHRVVFLPTLSLLQLFMQLCNILTLLYT